jgi:hypothetical protein
LKSSHRAVFQLCFILKNEGWDALAPGQKLFSGTGVPYGGRLFIFQLLGRGRRLRRKIAWLDCHFLRLGRGYELRGTPFCRWETPLSKTWRRMDDFMM